MTAAATGTEPNIDGEPDAPQDPADESAGEGGRGGAWLVAVLVVALLAGAAYFFLRTPWWSEPAPAAVVEAPQEPLVPPPASPDPSQVGEAYAEVGRVYASEGVSGLVREARRCFQSLQTRPSDLDFCLAYDMYAEAIHQESGAHERSLEAIWFSVADRRRAEAVRSTVGIHADPAGRLDEVRRLMRAAAGGGPGAQSALEPEPSSEAAAPPPRARPSGGRRREGPPRARPEDLSVEGLY